MCPIKQGIVNDKTSNNLPHKGGPMWERTVNFGAKILEQREKKVDTQKGCEIVFYQVTYEGSYNKFLFRPFCQRLYFVLREEVEVIDDVQ